MDHIAIMKKSWGMTDRILRGEKKIESRWYSVKSSPWGRIKSGDTVYFKNSGEPITIRAEVNKVMQFTDLTQQRIRALLRKYGKVDGIEKGKISKFFKLFKNKKYCMLIFLKNSMQIKPFDRDKTGFGTMSAWITIDNVSRIKR